MRIIIICIVIIILLPITICTVSFAEEKKSADSYERIDIYENGKARRYYGIIEHLPKGPPFWCYESIRCVGETRKKGVDNFAECIDTLNGESWSNEDGVCIGWLKTRECRSGRGGKLYADKLIYPGGATVKNLNKDRKLPKGEPFVCYKKNECEGEPLKKNVENVTECIMDLNGESWSDEEGVCLRYSHLSAMCS